MFANHHRVAFGYRYDPAGGIVTGRSSDDQAREETSLAKRSQSEAAISARFFG